MVKLVKIMNEEADPVQNCTVMPIENDNNSECNDEDLWEYEGTPLDTDDIEN